MYESAWLDCTHPGCPRGTYADPRHLPNITAGGGWTCTEHEAPTREDRATSVAGPRGRRGNSAEGSNLAQPPAPTAGDRQ